MAPQLDKFDESAKADFAGGITAALGVPGDAVAVTAARAGSVVVETAVAASDAGAAASLAAKLEDPR